MLMRLLFPPSIRSFRRLHKLALRSRGKSIKGFDCDELHIPSRDPGRRIRVRTYQPTAREEKLPVVLYLHGGGYALNVPESDHSTVRKFLTAAPCIVVAPDYRLSLEAPFPAALHDAFDTFTWVLSNSESLGADLDQVHVAGISAGGGLAIALALMARDLNAGRIAHLFPLYPMIDHRMQTESMRENDAPVWSEGHNKIAWGLYLEGPANYYASPFLAEDLEEFPPVTTFVGDLDPFRDEVLEFCRRVEKYGSEANVRTYKGAYHGFEVVNPKAEVSKRETRFLVESFSDAVTSTRA